MARNKFSIQWAKVLAALCALVFAITAAAPLVAKEKRGAAKAAVEDPTNPSKKYVLEHLDLTRIVWPNPPSIARIRYISQFYGEKRKKQPEQKAKWMDKLAGVAAGEQNPTDKLFFQLVRPYGLGVDSKGQVY